MKKTTREVQIPEELREKIIAYKQSFGSEAGTIAMKDLAAYCQIGLPSFVKREKEASDPLEMAFLEGRKSVYYHIKNIIEVDLKPA